MTVLASKFNDKYLSLVFLVLGFIWLRSGLEKLLSGKFVVSLGATLQKFSSGTHFSWYKDFLNSLAIPNSSTLGVLIILGELTAGAFLMLFSLLILLNASAKRWLFSLLLIGLSSGFLLNLNFWLAAGWTSSSTESLNLLMLLIELVGIGYSLAALFSSRDFSETP